jgi:hypothetical protein
LYGLAQESIAFDVAVVLGVDDEHCTLQLGTGRFQPGADLVAVAGVVHHDEQHGLFAQRLMLGVTLAPFLDTELQIILIVLGEDSAFVLLQARATRGIRQHRMFDDVLVNSLDQRIVGNGLYEDGAVVVPGRGGHIHLQSQTVILLQ